MSRHRVSIMLWLVLASSAGAQNTATVSSTHVLAGQRNAWVTIGLETSEALTGLDLQLRFNRGLCDQLTTQGLELTNRVQLGNEKVSIDVAETLGCPNEGRVSLVLVDLGLRPESGGAVIQPGEGPIARWVFSVRDEVPLGTETSIEVNVLHARNGPAIVPLKATPGAIKTTCVGDCGGVFGMVEINELITCVNISLDNAAVTSCPVCDGNGDRVVFINELITAVNNAVAECIDGDHPAGEIGG